MNKDAQRVADRLLMDWAVFGADLKFRGRICRIIEVCRHPSYPAVTVQWDALEPFKGKPELVRHQETITDFGQWHPSDDKVGGAK